MIIECKKSSSLLLAVVLLTSLNCLAVEESAQVASSKTSSTTLPSARNFYAGSWKQYACTAGTSLACAKAGKEFQKSSWNNSISINHPMLWAALSAGLISYNQYRLRSEKPINHRGHKINYFKPFATVVAVGGLLGLTHCALASAGYIDASSYGKSVCENSLIKNLALSAANGAMQAAFIAAPLAVTGGVAACVEKINDAASQIGQDTTDRVANPQDTIEDNKGKEEVQVEEEEDNEAAAGLAARLGDFYGNEVSYRYAVEEGLIKE